MVLAASTESRIEGFSLEMSSMSKITSTFTISDIKSDSIPDEDFQIPPD